MIIDSIEALSDHYGIPKEKIVSALQKDLSDNGNTNLIFITESMETSKIDYIVEGIVELEKRNYDNKVLREVSILKLKGKQVQNSKYNFSLLDGNFRIIESNISEDFTKMKKEPILVGKSDKISTGHENIDKVIDGLEYPGFHIIEEGEKVPKEVLENIISASLSNSCILNRGTITLPPFGYNSYQIKNMLKGYIPEEKIKNLLIMQQFLPEPDENIMELRGEDLYSDFDLNKIKNHIPDSKSPFTFLAGLNSL
ncbi:MAG: ATPase domain-containing protein [Thermoplasmatota archaeon]